MTSPISHVTSHLDELRKRLVISFIAIICCSAAAYLFSEQISRILMVPLLSTKQAISVQLVYTKLTEAFISYLKIAIFAGLFFSFPIILYELWMFVSPGLHKNERKNVLIIVLWATFLFVAGAGFAYFVVLPRVLIFFMGFSGPQLEPLPKLGGYLTFVARTVLAFGLSFEIPFLMFAAVKTGIVKFDYFRKKRMYGYAAILVLSILLAAGDLMASVLLAFPLIGLYEAGNITIRIFSSPA